MRIVPYLFFFLNFELHFGGGLLVNRDDCVWSNEISQVGESVIIVLCRPLAKGIKPRSILLHYARLVVPHALREETGCTDYLKGLPRIVGLFLNLGVLLDIHLINKDWDRGANIKLILICFQVVESLAVEPLKNFDSVVEISTVTGKMWTR